MLHNTNVYSCIGWVHFLKLEHSEALPCYIRLKNETRWSACFYAYLAAGESSCDTNKKVTFLPLYICGFVMHLFFLVLAGLTGDTKQSRELFLQSIKLVKRKNNNLEKFCSRRVSYTHARMHTHMVCITHTCWTETFLCFFCDSIIISSTSFSLVGWLVQEGRDSIDAFRD